MDDISKEMGALGARVGHLEDGLKDARERRKGLYDDVNGIKEKLAHFPEKEEWDTIKQMAKIVAKKEASRAAFWNDIHKAVATKGIIAALGVLTMFYWQELLAILKQVKGG